MKKISYIFLFLTATVFCAELPIAFDTLNNDTETVNNIDSASAILKSEKQKIRPFIKIEQRNISIAVPDAKNMLITIFLPNGRKITKKKITGEKAEFKLPRAAKREIIVTIDADWNYYSQKILLE